uniref:Uncharacterized protein n=1 Tax=Arundo donax TaxID=35708 RepID=A0A0A9BFA6_ARUDO
MASTQSKNSDGKADRYPVPIFFWQS